jgi:hypothetical protein
MYKVRQVSRKEGNCWERSFGEIKYPLMSIPGLFVANHMYVLFYQRIIRNHDEISFVRIEIWRSGLLQIIWQRCAFDFVLSYSFIWLGMWLLHRK